MTWVDPNTGEIHDAPAEGLIEVDDGELAPEEATSSPDMEWLGDWFTRQLCRLAAEREAAEAQHKARMAELKAREKALHWRWGEDLKALARDLLAGQKKKSLNFAYGKVGFRKARKVFVDDEEAAITWAKRHCPMAVKFTPRLLKSVLPEGQDVPGVRRWSGDEFFARPA